LRAPDKKPIDKEHNRQGKRIGGQSPGARRGLTRAAQPWPKRPAQKSRAGLSTVARAAPHCAPAARPSRRTANPNRQTRARRAAPAAPRPGHHNDRPKESGSTTRPRQQAAILAKKSQPLP